MHLWFEVFTYIVDARDLLPCNLLYCHTTMSLIPTVIHWLRVQEVPGSIPSQVPRHTKDVITMVPVVPLFGTQHSKGKILALSQELR